MSPQRIAVALFTFLVNNNLHNVFFSFWFHSRCFAIVNCSSLFSSWQLLLLLQSQFFGFGFCNIILWICKCYTPAMRAPFGLRILNQRIILFSFTFPSAQPPLCSCTHLQYISPSGSLSRADFIFVARIRWWRRRRRSEKWIEEKQQPIAWAQAVCLSFYVSFFSSYSLTRVRYCDVSRIEMYYKQAECVCMRCRSPNRSIHAVYSLHISVFTNCNCVRCRFSRAENLCLCMHANVHDTNVFYGMSLCERQPHTEHTRKQIRSHVSSTDWGAVGSRLCVADVQRHTQSNTRL